jgi:thiol-disulfide isomerase/thioredoxin
MCNMAFQQTANRKLGINDCQCSLMLHSDLAVIMNRRLTILILLCVGLGVFAFLGGSGVSRLLTFQLLIRQEAPSEEALFDIISSTAKPDAYLQSLWDTGKIPHRHLTIKLIHQRLFSHPEDLSIYGRLIQEAVADADFANRELAMGILDVKDPEKLRDVVPRSLRDSDQGTRLRALQYVKVTEDARWIPEFMRLLDDPDEMIVAHAASKLRQWTGEDFGIRMMHAITRLPQTNQPASLNNEQEIAFSKGIAGWKQWWHSGKHDYPVSNQWESDTEPYVTPALPVEDFEVGMLDGSTKRLSDFRGKAVLLNFWTTWCSACMTEMPDLNQLHDLYPDNLKVIGISLDGGEDHGHEHASVVDIEEAREAGLEAVESEYGLHDHSHQEHAHDDEKIKKKIERVVRKKDLKYLIGMDSGFEIGNRFNGQELPTNVLIDPQGKLRRRFVGARPLHSWKAMLKDIGVPEPPYSN